MYLNIVLIFFLLLLVPPQLFSQNKNYIKLEEVKKRLQYNELTYLELVKIEKELNKDLNKLNINIKKYKKAVAKGFNQKNNLKKIVFNSDKKLKDLKNHQAYLIQKKSIILNNLIYLTYKGNNTYLIKQSSQNIFVTINKLEKKNNLALKELKSTIVKNTSLLKKLNSSLNNIELSLNRRSNQMEGLIGETIITAVEKAENKLQKSKIKKEVNEIKSLIQKFENTKKNKKKFGSFSFSKLNDILPIGNLNIKNIKTDDLKTGILLSLKNDTMLKTPKDSLVVYADFFKGYGKMVILDLGNNYHLILSGLTNISCKIGDWLEKGTKIGDINISNNEIVYMEFRFKGKTINPSKWARS